MKGWQRFATGLAIVLGAKSGESAADTYYPYQFYEEYHRQDKAAPPPAAAGPQREAPARRPARTGEPGVPRQAPLFLFPRGLPFGVAVGVPEDLFYLADSYYQVQGGSWYRAASYRGPWTRVPRGKLPPELVRHDLAAIRRERSREYRQYWEEQGRYKGRVFRPGTAPGKPGEKQPN